MTKKAVVAFTRKSANLCLLF